MRELGSEKCEAVRREGEEWYVLAGERDRLYM